MSIARNIVTVPLIWAVMFSIPSMSAQQEVGPDQNGVYRRGPGVVMPKALKTFNAVFSDLASRRRVSGEARVQIVVDADGNVRDPKIVRSISEKYPDGEDHQAALTLDQSALDAVTHYVFEPGSIQGRAVPVYVNVDVDFQIYHPPVQEPPKDESQITVRGSPNSPDQPAASPVQPEHSKAGMVYGRAPGVVMPRILQSVEASYTEDARKRKIKGQAMLQVIVNTDGTIRSVRITKSIAEAYSLQKIKPLRRALMNKRLKRCVSRSSLPAPTMVSPRRHGCPLKSILISTDPDDSN
jgi:TonB family protein